MTLKQYLLGSKIKVRCLRLNTQNINFNTGLYSISSCFGTSEHWAFLSNDSDVIQEKM